MRFKFTISHVPGKDLVTADALSRAPLPVMAQLEVLPDTAIFVDNIIGSLPASEK